MATIVAAAGGGNWNVTTTWVGGVVPTAADDVQLAVTSGAVTITAAAVCRSLDCNTYTNTLTHNAAVTVSIGTTTAGLGNIALQLGAGMTYTLGNASSSAFSFISTSATVQTVTTNGKVLGNLTFSGSGSSYQLADTLTATGGQLTLAAGTLNTNSQTVTISSFSSGSGTRVLTLGSSNVTIVGFNGFQASGTITFSANTAVVTLTADPTTLGLGGLNSNGTSFILSSVGSPTFINGGTVANLTRTGTAVKTDTLMFNSGSWTITGTLTLTGNSTTNRLTVKSGTVGTAITVNAAAVSLTNVDFADITAAGAAIPFSGTSLGDSLGNSNITFTTPVTRYAVTAGNWSSTGTWSASSGGASGASVPLCHDTVFLDANTGAGTYTADMSFMGKDVTCTGFTGTLALSGNLSITGSLTLAVGMTLTTGGGALIFLGRSVHTITSAGRVWSGSITINGPGGTYSLADNLVMTGTLRNLTVTSAAVFTSNGFTITAATITFTTVTTLNLGASNITCYSTLGGAVFTNTATTSNSSAATIISSGVSSSSRTFIGGGKSYATLTYSVSGSTGALVITGANTFGTINFSDAANARTLTLPSATTTTMTGAFNVQGTAGKLMTVNSSTSGTTATLSRASGTVACNYLSLKDSTATGGATWYAGGNSVSVSNVSGWIFSQAPAIQFFEFLD